jgi:hypothetical protein
LNENNSRRTSIPTETVGTACAILNFNNNPQKFLPKSPNNSTNRSNNLFGSIIDKNSPIQDPQKNNKINNNPQKTKDLLEKDLKSNI